MGNLFDEFWAAYPKHVAKGAAERAFEKAIKLADAATITAGALRYRMDVDARGTDDKYIAHAATWLNAKRWEDKYEERLTPMQRELAIGGRAEAPPPPVYVHTVRATEREPIASKDWPKRCSGWTCECNPRRNEPVPEDWPGR